MSIDAPQPPPPPPETPPGPDPVDQPTIDNAAEQPQPDDAAESPDGARPGDLAALDAALDPIDQPTVTNGSEAVDDPSEVAGADRAEAISQTDAVDRAEAAQTQSDAVEAAAAIDQPTVENASEFESAVAEAMTAADQPATEDVAAEEVAVEEVAVEEVAAAEERAAEEPELEAEARQQPDEVQAERLAEADAEEPPSTQGQPESATEEDSAGEAEPAADAEAEPDPAEADPDPETDAEADGEPVPETDADAEAQPEPVTDADAEAEQTAERSPDSDAAAVRQDAEDSWAADDTGRQTEISDAPADYGTASAGDQAAIGGYGGAEGSDSQADRDVAADRRMAQDILSIRAEQEILREQGNEEAVRNLDVFISKLPLADATKNDPQAYLDSDTQPETQTDRDAAADRRMAQDILSIRAEQEILREQGNEEAVVNLDEFISKLPLDDAIKNDPRAYLDAVQRGESFPAERGPAAREPPGREPLGEVRRSFVERLPVPERFAEYRQSPGGDIPTAWEVLTGKPPEHVDGLYDRRDIGAQVESAAQPTTAPDAPIEDVNRFSRLTHAADGTPQSTYLWNCSACVKAVDARLSGVEPDAHAGFIADPPGADYAARVTDSVFAQALEREWGRPVEHGDASAIEQSMLDAGPGARGVLLLEHHNDKGARDGGHVANLVNRDGRVMVIDGQIGRRFGSLRAYLGPGWRPVGVIPTYP